MLAIATVAIVESEMSLHDFFLSQGQIVIAKMTLERAQHL